MIDFFFLIPIAIGLEFAGLASFIWSRTVDMTIPTAAQRIPRRSKPSRSLRMVRTR
jgi:hypothetical protein